MRKGLASDVLLVPSEESLKKVITKLVRGGKKCFGVALVVDRLNRLRGLLNQGDLLRLISHGVDLAVPVGSVVRSDPVCVEEGWSEQKIADYVRETFRQRTQGRKEFTQYVPVLDRQQKVVAVADMYEILARLPSQGQPVAIYGLGYVGLTLAAALASRGHAVLGVDVKAKIVSELKAGRSHVHEPRLHEMLQQGLSSGLLKFSGSNSRHRGTMHILAVGTPVGISGKPDFTQLRQACRALGPTIRRGDLIMLRSTLPVGTTRKEVVPLLEKIAGLKAGRAFHVAFCPERTIEGRALYELFSLPQIVGGLTDACYEKAAVFWATLTDSVIRAESLEAAELIKLLNNSFRDLSFAFANAAALWADRFNLDVHKLVASANEGYPRNPIPKPSPGVGGYCLTKDPLLFAGTTRLEHALLARLGRQINLKASLYPLQLIQRHLRRTGLSWRRSKVVILGIAFKGDPPTNDLRGSTALILAENLRRRGVMVRCWDAVVSEQGIRMVGLVPARWPRDLAACDAVMIFNSHPHNIADGFLRRLSKTKPVLVFDGWGLLDRSEVEQRKNLTYATMGYMSEGHLMVRR